MADEPERSPNPTAGTISAPEAAKLLLLESPRRIQQLAADGYIEKAGQGRYNTVSVVQGYIRFLREERKHGTGTASENRVRDARARALELANARDEKELVDMAEAEAVIEEIAGLLRSEFIGFPAEMTRDLPMRRKLETGIDGIFKRVSTRIAETVGALKSSGKALDPDTEDDS